MASIKLFWNPDSPPCRLVWALLRQGSTAFESEVVPWNRLRHRTSAADVPAQMETETGQIPWMQTAAGAVLDSLACVMALLPDARNWIGSADFHVFRLAEIHGGRLLQFCYWQRHTLCPPGTGSAVRATTTPTSGLAESELRRIRGLYQVIARSSLAKAPQATSPLTPGLLALGIHLDFIEALSGRADTVLDASIAQKMVWTGQHIREDLRLELCCSGAKVDGFCGARWGG